MLPDYRKRVVFKTSIKYDKSLLPKNQGLRLELRACGKNEEKSDFESKNIIRYGMEEDSFF